MIADKLLTVGQNDQAIAEAVEDIRLAIVAKEVPVAEGTPIGQLPAKIAAIEGGGGGSEQWEIPSEWPGNISEVADNEIKMIFLRSCPVRFNISTSGGALNVDWGDGVVEYGVSTYNIFHDYSTSSGGVFSASVGAEIWVARFWVVSGTINSITLGSDPDNYPFASASPLVAMSIGATNISTFYHVFQTMYGSGQKVYSPNLQYVKIKHFGPNCTTLYSSSYSPYGIFYFCRSLRRVDLPDSWNNVTNITKLFSDCPSLESLTLPTSWNKITEAGSLFYAASSLKKIVLPESWGLITNVSSFFNQCRVLETVNIPSSWGSVTNASEFFRSCRLLTHQNLPTSWGSVANLQYFMSDCGIKNITIPAFSGLTTTIERMFYGCSSLVECIFEGLEGVNNANYCLYECPQLMKVVLPASSTSILYASNMFSGYTVGTTKTEIVNIENFGSQSADCDFTNFLYLTSVMISLVLNARIKQLGIPGHKFNSSSISSIRLPNAVNSAFEGSSPQIDIQYCSLDADALNLLFSDLPALTGKTIRITGNPGASTCDTTIATSKGWTVTI